eukprot:Phypoly_transcript_29062.p1 GENE.Phypoly_transcript_29062~~Phypoly_transcript_29062.p1  ORF type:complete len:109 (+),score=19.55 Phypoly_transcript_29062:106-432(+)
MSYNSNLESLKALETKIIKMMQAASTSFESLAKSDDQKFMQSSSEYLSLLKDIQEGLRAHIFLLMDPMPYANSCYAPRITLENAALTTQLALSHIQKIKAMYDINNNI